MSTTVDAHNYRVVKHTEGNTVFFGIRWVMKKIDGSFEIHPDEEIPAGKTPEELAMWPLKP